MLPEYMIPSDVFFLDSIPMHPNGKINRDSLPDPDDLKIDLKPDFEEPSDTMEKEVAQIWQELLKLDRISKSDNFFEIGGHSLLLVNLASKLNYFPNTKVAITDLYKAQTIEQQADLLRKPTGLDSAYSSGDSSYTFFWIHGNRSNESLPKYLDSSPNLHFIMHESADGKAPKFKTLSSIVQNHFKEIRQVQKKGPYYLGGYCVGGVIAFEIAQELVRIGEQVSLLFLLDPSEPQNPNREVDEYRYAQEMKSYTSTNNYNTERFYRNSLNRFIGDKLLKYSEKNFYKVLYFKRKIRKKITKTKLGLVRLSLLFGFKIPFNIRHKYIVKIYEKALKNYKPKSYPGKVIIFKGEKSLRVTESNWIALEADDKTIYRIDDADHGDILLEPHIEIWANKLNYHLREQLK